MKKMIVLCLVAVFALTACAAPETKTGKGAAYGAAAGAAAGALIGQIAGRNTQSTLTGAAIGAAVGGATGAGVGKMMDDQEKEFNEALSASEAAAVTREGDILAISLKGDVTFETGSATVLPGLHSELDHIADIMVKYPQTSIIVEGHTDSVGKEDKNMELSRRRAEAVRDLLVQRGVSDSRIQVEAYGETRPIADNKSDSGRRLNRRVEIKVAPMGT
jgi:outer membrane protein OmpA-like peptidoglycan-associated protein